MDRIVYWVWLVMCFGASNYRIWDVLSLCDNDPVLSYKRLKADEVQGITDNEKKSVSTTHIEQACNIVDYCSQKNISIISFEDDSYPNRLKGIYNPPSVLFCMGSLDFVDNEVCLAVVGTRHPSPYSIKFAQRICDELVKVGVVLVSGFALGIDSMAHQAALKNNERTIAVLGCGLDYPYPKENSAVKKVIARKGAVISEYLPGSPPSGKNFPLRNRIISGLCLGTLIIEAGMKSGALITAECALQQGRDVFCVPPADLFDERYSGVIRLIRDGAIPVFNHIDILYEYYDNFTHKLNAPDICESYDYDNKKSEEKNGSQEYKGVVQSNISNDIKVDTSDFSVLQKEIYDLLIEHKVLLSDEISSYLGIEVSEILSELTELELSGAVKALSGNRYSL